jgi:hypothetical protein
MFIKWVNVWSYMLLLCITTYTIAYTLYSEYSYVLCKVKKLIVIVKLHDIYNKQIAYKFLFLFLVKGINIGYIYDP